MSEYKYKAFLSYRHQTEHTLASALETGLQKFAKPFYLPRGLRIYRDERNQNLTDDLLRDVKAAMDDSEFFILMASPGSRKSKWVPKEVQHWLDNRSLNHFLIVRCDGSIEWDKNGKDEFDWEATDCLPDNLRGRFKSMPLYADLKEVRDEKNLTLKNELFRQKVAHISAKLRGISLEDMYGEEARQHKRFKRVALSVIVLLIALLVFAGERWLAAKTSLARTQWGNGVYFRDRGETVRAAHWFAKAVGSPDRDLAQAARLAAAQAIRGGRLENIFVHNEARVKAGHCDLSAGISNPCALNDVAGIAFSDGETKFLSWGGDGVLDYVDIADGQALIQARCGEEPVLCHDNRVYGAVMSGDGSRLLSWDADDSVRIWCLEDCAPGLQGGYAMPGEPYLAAAAAVGPQDFRFLGWNDERAWLWDVGTEPVISLHPECGESRTPILGGAQLDRLRPRILMWGSCQAFDGTSDSGVLWSWDIEPPSGAGDISLPPVEGFEHGRAVIGLAADETGSRILTRSDEDVRLWEPDGGDGGPVSWHKVRMPENFPAIRGAQLNTAGTLLLTWSTNDDNAIRIWDLDNRREAMPPLYYDNFVRGAAFYSGDSRVLAWGNKGTIRSWKIELQPHQLQSESVGHPIPGNPGDDPSSTCPPDLAERFTRTECMSYPDRDLLLSWQTERGNGETAYTVRLWNLSGRAEIDDPLELRGEVTGARLDDAGKRILTWSGDTVRLWGRRTHKELIPGMSHDNRVVGARFNSDESRILSWSSDYTVRLWSASSGESVIRPLKVPESQSVKDALFTAGEDCVVARDASDKLWLWDLSFDTRGGAREVQEMVEASTGTRLDAEGGLEVMPRDEWPGKP
jgi:WD40 repeat protein